MLGLLDYLRALTEQLRTLGGSDILLYRLRVWLAAQLILDDPGLIPFDNSGPEADYIAPAEEGERLANDLRADGKRVVVVEVTLHEEAAPANKRTDTIGPFRTADRRLVRFDIYVASPAEWITLSQEQPPGAPEPLLLLPVATSPGIDGVSLSVPAGTVWIAAHLLAPGAPRRFVGLRVAGGEVTIPGGLPGASGDGGWHLGPGEPWRARFLPEQPIPAGPEDLHVRLPDALGIGSGAAMRIEGGAVLRRGGEATGLPPAGSPVAAAEGIRIPLVPGGEIDTGGSAPEPLRLNGRHRIAAAAFVLPFSVSAGLAGEADGGGLLDLDLGQGRSTASVDGTMVALDWTAGRLQLVAGGWRWQVTEARGFGTVDITSWRGAHLRFAIGAGPKPVNLAWTAAGDISLLIQKGSVTTGLDLPLAADGRPLDLTATGSAALGLMRRTDGSWLSTVDAVVPDADVRRLPRRGYTIPNLFVTLRGPHRLLGGGRGTRLGTIDDGAAWLELDALAAEPMLPDPYANNWTGRPARGDGAGAMEVTLRWHADARPSVTAALAGTPAWPEPSTVHGARFAVDLAFQDHLRDATRSPIAVGAGLKLVDLSSAAQQFGIEMDRDALAEASLGADAHLAVRTRNARLFLLPQVQWEPVRNLNVDTAGPIIRSTSQGMPAFAGAASDDPVRALPEDVAWRIVRAHREGDTAAVLFSLPFGLRAYADLGPDATREGPRPARIEEHRVHFDDDVESAAQLRLEAQDRDGPGEVPLGEARGMRGRMASVRHPNDPVDVLPGAVRQMVEASFRRSVPLHRADLSGYGLSCFSRWRFDPSPGDDFVGVAQVRFDVMIGRTCYEVVELRSYLICPQCRVVRSVVIERTNAGIVERFDTGWKAIDDGTFDRFVPFETGLVRRFTNIRNITVLPRPHLAFLDPAPPPPKPPVRWEWQAVRYDADAHLGDAHETVVPIRDHLGYIPILPVAKPAEAEPSDTLTPEILRALFEAVGGSMGGPADAHLSVAETLPLHVTGIHADRVRDAGPGHGFIVAVTGTPTLPRIGRWNAVRLAADGSASAVDARRGLPLVRAPGTSAYRFSEPADAYSPAADRFGFLADMDGCRLLFPQPTIDPATPGTMNTLEPELADAYALSQTVGLLPPRARRLLTDKAGAFAVRPNGDWQLVTSDLVVHLAESALAGTAKWQMTREVEEARKGIGLVLDTAASVLKVEREGTDSIDITLPGFPKPLLSLVGTFVSEIGRGPEGATPKVIFGPALAQLRDLVNALDNFTRMPLPFDIDVNAVPGPTPAFDVRLRLRVRVPGGQNERIDIGVGKFSGRFEAEGRLRAALAGPAQGVLQLSFEGDLQQGILPPLLYAGGYFRFAITIADGADPVVHLGFATTASIGGDLIPGLISLEVTVRYGYTLVPETLEPGVLLGLEARAKLLSGLLGVSFRTDVLARIRRLDAGGLPDPEAPTITIFAELKVVATIEVLWGLVDDERELRTSFEQELPLAPLAVVAGAHPLLLTAELL